MSIPTPKVRAPQAKIPPQAVSAAALLAGAAKKGKATSHLAYTGETCARRRAHEATVVVETPTGALRVSFQHRYCKLGLDREEHLRQVLGDDFERFFKRTVSLKVKKEVAEDPAQLEQMVMALAEALGAENFASLFEVEQSLAPTKAYTETSCQLPAETRAALNLAGVRQIVALTAK
jgi:hypothetical protein